MPPAPIRAATANPAKMRTRLPDFGLLLMTGLLSKPVGLGNTLIVGSAACGSPGSLALHASVWLL